MNAIEFEQEVRKMRQLQRRFFACKKDNPDRPHAKEMMREQEKVVRDVTDVVMAIRPRNKKPENIREEFFLNVVEMMSRQRLWAMSGGGGSWMMNPAREMEVKVDKQLSAWEEERKEELRRRNEEELKKQTSLFE